MKRYYLVIIALGAVFVVKLLLASGIMHFTDVRVTSKGSDETNAFCQGFSLSDIQAKSFFTKSHVIDIKILHDEYDYLPCYVRGTAKVDGKSCSWEIRAGGTAEVKCGKKNNYMFACDDCDEMLQDEVSK
jgi:hypothetical protein